MGFIAVSWETEKKGPCCSVGDFVLWCELTPNLGVVAGAAGVVAVAIGEMDDKTEKESESSNEGERGKGEVLLAGLLGPTDAVLLLLLEGLLDVGGGAASVLFGAVSNEGRFCEFMFGCWKEMKLSHKKAHWMLFLSLHTQTQTRFKRAFLSNVRFYRSHSFLYFSSVVEGFRFSLSLSLSTFFFSTRYKACQTTSRLCVVSGPKTRLKSGKAVSPSSTSTKKELNWI